MSIAIIINPVAGGARIDRAHTRADIASSVVERQGVPAEIFVTERRGHAHELTAAAVGRGVSLVIAWGGDGTVSEVGSALAFSRTALGIVPAGSGNGLARELGVDPRPERAIVQAIQAVPRSMDVGELEGRLFLNLAGIGFDAHVASAFDDPKNRHRGFLRYAGITARSLWSYQPAEYSITTAERHIHVRAVIVTVANSAQFGNGARIAPGARVDDGKLDLVVIEERARWRTVIQLPRLFIGTVDRVAGYSLARIASATIESDRPMLFHVDGEPVLGGTRLRARVHPSALRIAVK